MLFTIFLILFGVGAFISSFSYLVFWYEAANTPHQTTLETCSGRGGVVPCILRGFLTSVFSQLVVYATYPLALIRPSWKFSPGCARPPVLLVHGLYHNASAWFLYKWILRRAGFKTIFCWSYNSMQDDFWQLAEQLKNALSEATTLCEGRKVICIGHSMGGLLIRAALADPASAKMIAAAVTLGTPHQGSKMSALALGALGRSIIHNGALVRKLNAMRSPARLPKLNLFSPIDNMVIPASSLSVPEPGWVETATAPISHVNMLYHLPTIALVLDYLEETFPLAHSAYHSQEKCLAGSVAKA